MGKLSSGQEEADKRPHWGQLGQKKPSSLSGYIDIIPLIWFLILMLTQRSTFPVNYVCVLDNTAWLGIQVIFGLGYRRASGAGIPFLIGPVLAFWGFFRHLLAFVKCVDIRGILPIHSFFQNYIKVFISRCYIFSHNILKTILWFLSKVQFLTPLINLLSHQLLTSE